MKKIFTKALAIVSLMLISICANAAEVVYSWDGNGKSSVTEVGGTSSAKGGDSNTVVGSSQKGNFCFKLGKSYSSGTHYIEIELNSALNGGETISLCAFITSADKEATVGINFNGSNELTYKIEDVLTSNGTPSTTKNFTVPSAAAGTTKIRLYRSTGGTAGYVSKFEITSNSDTRTSTAAPSISYEPAETSATVTIKNNETTAAGNVYYTTDGSTPTASSIEYTAPFEVTNNCTVKAIFIPTDGETYKSSDVTSEKVETTAPKSNVATLDDIKVNGVSISNFATGTTSYNYDVNNDIVAVPTVDYTLTDPKATAVITVATSIQGTTKIVVTAEDGTTTKTYQVTWKYPVVELPEGKSYLIQKNQSITAGSSIETNVDGITLVCGSDGTWKDGKEEKGYVPNFIAYTEGNGNNPTLGSDKIPTGGTFYKFEVSKSGVLIPGIVCNGSRTIIVVDGEGNSVYSLSVTSKVYKTISFNVEAGKDYYMYASGTKLGFYGFTFDPAPTPSSVSVPVNATTGISSFCSDYALDFTDVAGIEAYAVTEVGKTSVKLTKVKKVAAGEGIFVKGTKGTTTDVPVATEAVEKNTDNLLFGTKAATEVGENFYALSASDGKVHPVTSGTIAKGKAYLVIASQVKGGLSLDFDDDATAADVVEAAAEQNVEVKKFFVNGQLLIQTANGLVNAAGAQVK